MVEDDYIMTPGEVVVTAAVFARTNMGFPLPEKKPVRFLLGDPDVSLDEAVEALCREFMEGEEGFAAFREEAESWHEQIPLMGVKEMRRVFPEHLSLVLGDA